MLKGFTSRWVARLAQQSGETFQMTVSIREARAGDEGTLVRLNGFAQDLHATRRPEHFRQTQTSELAAWYKSVLETASARLLIAEEEQAPVGYLSSIIHHAPETPLVYARRWCEIDQIAVDPAYRRRGIARALIARAIAAAEAEGIRQIEATCWSFNNPGQHLFLGLRFMPRTVRLELKLRE